MHAPVSVQLIESAEIEWTSILPDIAIYDHFSKTYMSEFDYTLFCHNDVVINNQNIFEEMIITLNNSDWEQRPYDLIASVSTNAIEFLSIRFHPCFLFIPTTTFVNRKLSFSYPEHLGNVENFFWYDNKIDGGAQLLASYYHKDNSNNIVPFTQIHGRWFKHIKADKNGMEFTRLRGGSDSYKDKIQEAENSLNI